MEKKYNRSLFIFRRDLRLDDNSGLLEALDNSSEVIPIFVFDSNQIDSEKNGYFSERAFQFMVRSLEELREALKSRNAMLYAFEGDMGNVLKKLLEEKEIDAVYVNKDYTPFSRKRDKDLSDVCEKYHTYFFRVDDYALSPIEDIRTGAGKAYTVYTPFMKNAIDHQVEKPVTNSYKHFYTENIKGTVSLSSYIKEDDTSFLRGGRKEGLAILENPFYLTKYKENRNIPSLHNTSRLSAHHKFGTISIRETFHTAKDAKNYDPHFISELYWRDFYMYIAYHFPYVFGKSFLPWAENIEWINDKDQFEAWCEGRTGVPMVDAGMRELNATGWMHNRSRMIVASYLTKNLLIDWRWGEKYFAKQLIDYDPMQNNGGWQWAASVGADPRPLRIFNPYTQAVNYDPEALYIKKWVSELKNVDSKILTDGKTQDLSDYADYPKPIVDQKESYHRVIEVYKNAKISQNE